MGKHFVIHYDKNVSEADVNPHYPHLWYSGELDRDGKVLSGFEI